MNVFTAPFKGLEIDENGFILFQVRPQLGSRLQIVGFTLSFQGVTSINTPVLIETGTASEDFSMTEAAYTSRILGETFQGTVRVPATGSTSTSTVSTVHTSHYTDPNGRFTHQYRDNGPVILGDDVNMWSLSALSETVPLPVSGSVSWRRF